jgi:arginyl-tRNA synthetase
MNEEWELVKHAVLYPEVIQESARRLEPHRVTYFLDSLAADFHTYYNQGWLDPKARVICHDQDLTQARLLLVQALRVVLRNALTLLGVEAPQKM